MELAVEMESGTTVAMGMASTAVIIGVVTAVGEMSHDGDDHRNQMLAMWLLVNVDRVGSRTEGRGTCVRNVEFYRILFTNLFSGLSSRPN